MSPDERDRLRLLRRLEEVLGPDEAAILMTNLPPDRWTELATSRDLEAIDGRLAGFEQRFLAIDARFEAVNHRFDAIDARFEAVNHRFDAIDHRFDAFRSELIGTIDGAFRRQTRVLLGLMIALATLVLTTAELVS